MIRKLLLRLLVLLALLLPVLIWLLRPLPVLAGETTCIGLADLLAGLHAKYGESVIWTGITDTALLVVTANPDGSSWTSFVQRSDDKGCVFAHGEQWLPGSAPAPPLLGKEG